MGDAYPFSGADLERAGLSYLRYSELAAVPSIEELLPRPGDGIAILYEVEPHNGHWTLIQRRADGLIEFLDAYGLAPDDELEKAAHSAKSGPILSRLLGSWVARGGDLEALGVPLQEPGAEVATCGRYVALRWLDRAQPGGLTPWMRKRKFGPNLRRNDDLVVAYTRSLHA